MRTFKKTLEMLTSSRKGQDAINISSECLYNLGLCYMEEGSLLMVSVCLEAEIICDFELVACISSVSEGYLQ